MIRTLCIVLLFCTPVFAETQHAVINMNGEETTCELEWWTVFNYVETSKSMEFVEYEPLNTHGNPAGHHVICSGECSITLWEGNKAETTDYSTFEAYIGGWCENEADAILQN